MGRQTSFQFVLYGRIVASRISCMTHRFLWTLEGIVVSFTWESLSFRERKHAISRTKECNVQCGVRAKGHYLFRWGNRIQSTLCDFRRACSEGRDKRRWRCTNGASGGPAMSALKRYVLFYS